MRMPLKTARAIVEGSQAHAATADLAPLALVVLDAGGHLIVAERNDGAAFKRIEIAHAKAHGALALGVGSRALMKRAESQAYFIAAATAAVGGALMPVPGGVLIRDQDGEIIGAVGISGDTSDADEAACVAGVLGAGFVPQVD